MKTNCKTCKFSDIKEDCFNYSNCPGYKPGAIQFMDESLDNDYQCPYYAGIIRKRRKIMTSKEKILEYLKRKNKFIKNITGLNYCYDSDFDDVEKWEDRICDQIWSEMLAYAKNQKLVLTKGNLSAKLCPWCLFKHFMLIDCVKCGWGRAHGGGNCMTYDFENSWPKIRMALKNKGHDDYNSFFANMVEDVEKFKPEDKISKQGNKKQGNKK